MQYVSWAPPIQIQAAGRTRWIAATLTALLLLSGPTTARAEEDEAPEVEPLSVRIYPIGALTEGRTPFHSEFEPIQRVRPAVRPRRRGVSPEPRHPVGTADEVIELMKGRVMPAYWEVTEGVDVATLGGQALVVRAGAGVHAEFARHLADLERRHLRTISVDVQAVRLSAEQLRSLSAPLGGMRLDDERVKAILASNAAGPAVRITTENGLQAEAFGGHQSAFLRRHEAVTYEGKAVAIPVAGVTNMGFAVAIEPVIHADERSVHVQLQANLTATGTPRALKTAEGHTVELPSTPGLQVRTDLVVTPGVWALAHGATEGWSILVRAMPSAQTGLSRRATSISLDAPYEARPGEMEVRDFDVASLSRVIGDVIGRGAFLYDTSADGPGERERDEPSPTLGADALCELVIHTIGTEATWEDPATIEARNGMLIVRQTKPVLAAIDGWLDRLRRSMPATYATTVEFVEVTPTLARSLVSPERGAGEAWLLDADEQVRLARALQEEEDAFRIGTARLTHVDGRRNTSRSGRTLRYVSTYQAQAAKGALSVLPRTAEVLEGFEVDARVTRTPGGGAAHVALRAMRTDTRRRAMRTVTTQHGPLELPSLETLRLRSHLTVPLGRTAVAGVLPRGGQRILVLVTVQPQSRER